MPSDGNLSLQVAINAIREEAIRNAVPGLLKAANVLAAIPLEDFGHQTRPDAYQLMGWNGYELTVGDVKSARLAVAAVTKK